MSIRNPKSKTQNPEELFLVGRVMRAHGVQGEMKVLPETDDPERFEDFETLYIGPSAEQTQPHDVQTVRFQQTKKHGLVVLVRLEGIDTPEDADALRRALVFAPEDALPPLDEDEFFLHDLEGFTVLTEDGEEIGVVKEVLEMPAQFIFVVARPNRPDALIPHVAEFVLDLDLDAERLTVRPIEGLLE